MSHRVLSLMLFIVAFLRAEWVQTNFPSDNVVSSIIMDGKNIYVASGTVYHSDDQGDSWSSLDSGWTAIDSISGSKCCGISLATNENYLFAGTNDGRILRLDKGTRVWTEIHFEPNPSPTQVWTVNFNSIVTKNDTIIAASSYRSQGFRMCRSLDDGDSWDCAGGGGGGHLLIVGTTILNGGVGINGNIYLSYDLGKTWTLNTELPLENYSASLASREGYVLAAGYEGVFRSSDTGKTWIQVTDILVDGTKILDLTAVAASGDMLFAGSSRAGVYASQDNGAAWISMNDSSIIGYNDSLSGSRISELAVIDSILFAGVYNSNQKRGVWKYALKDLVLTGSSTDRAKVNLGLKEIDIFDSKIHLRFDIEHTSIVSLVVYNSQGQEVKTFEKSKLTPGSHYFTLDFRKMKRGAYFLSINTEKFRQTRKFIF